MNGRNWVILGLSAALAACASTPPPADQAQGATSQQAQPTGPAATQSGAQPRSAENGSTNAATLRAPTEHSVYFEFDSSAIPASAATLIQAHARYINGNPLPMRVEGNADARGSHEYNIALGQRRAEAVRRALMIDGARSESIEAISYGKERPRCSDATEECYATNRRADIVSAR